MGVNSLPKTVTRQRRGCDWNPGPTAPESSALTTRLPSHRYNRRLALLTLTLTRWRYQGPDLQNILQFIIRLYYVYCLADVGW